MPITDQHLEYAAALPVWLRHRDVLRGEDAVKARGPVPTVSLTIWIRRARFECTAARV